MGIRGVERATCGAIKIKKIWHFLPLFFPKVLIFKGVCKKKEELNTGPNVGKAELVS